MQEELSPPPLSHQVNLRRHDSALSLTSNASKGTFGHGHHREVKEKLSEIETFRDILCRQVDKLQTYFDAAGSDQNKSDISNGSFCFFSDQLKWQFSYSQPSGGAMKKVLKKKVLIAWLPNVRKYFFSLGSYASPLVPTRMSRPILT